MEHVLPNMTRLRKGKAKEIDQEALLRETIQPNDNTPERQGKVYLIVFRVSTTKEEIAVTIESVVIDILRIVNTSRKIQRQMAKDCPFTHSQKKKLSTSPKGKGKGKKSEKEQVTGAIVDIANHRRRNTSGKLLQFETSMNTHLRAEGNLEQVGRSKMPMEGVLALKRKLPSEKRIIRFSL